MARPQTTPPTPFAAALRAAREAAGLSVWEASRKSGIQPHNIYAYEGGRQEPLATALLALCDAYGIDPRGLPPCK